MRHKEEITNVLRKYDFTDIQMDHLDVGEIVFSEDVGYLFFVAHSDVPKWLSGLIWRAGALFEVPENQRIDPPARRYLYAPPAASSPEQPLAAFRPNTPRLLIM